MKNFIDKLFYILFIFLVSALIGGIIEIIYNFAILDKYVLGGFLYGPLRPIYGWGALILYFISKKFNRNLFITFISAVIICSIFEYLSSYILELIFHYKWWDYSNFMFNINGRICLIISLCWGTLAIIFTKFVEPILNKIYNRFNKKVLYISLIIIYVIYKVDGTISIINYLNR